MKFGEVAESAVNDTCRVSAMVAAPAVPGVPVPNNAGPIAVPLSRFAAATVPSDRDKSANAPAATTPPSKPATLLAVMAIRRTAQDLAMYTVNRRTD
eukprot:jgi/Tetstr1/423964/TSEL_014575.t1